MTRDELVKMLRDTAPCLVLCSEFLQAADILEADAPAEKQGSCACGEWVWGVAVVSYCGIGDPPLTVRPAEEGETADWYFRADPAWGTDAWDGHPKFCPDCGSELCADGVAERHKDAARVDFLQEFMSPAECLEVALHGDEEGQRVIERRGYNGTSYANTGADLRAVIDAAFCAENSDDE